MKRISVYEMTTCAIMAALMCVLGPFSVPIGPVPVSLTNFVVYLAVVLLGARGATIAVGIYLLLGLVGLPVFSGFQGGVGKLAGPTGGYLVGFLLVALIGGIIAEKSKRNILFTILGLVAATAVLYAFGTAWFMFEMKTELVSALSMCVFPFIPFDLFKIVVGTIFGKVVRNAIVKSGLQID